jgi:hypothetical protein
MSLRTAAQQALEALKMIDNAMPFPVAKHAIKQLSAALAEPEQEPVAWQGVHDTTDLYWRKPMQGDVRPLYTHPPQRKPLTDEEIELLAAKHAPPIDPDFGDDDWIEFARAIERAHGIGGQA